MRGAQTTLPLTRFPKMTQQEINIAIENAFQKCARISWDLFDAWYERLHNISIEGVFERIEQIPSEFNETNLNLMLAGVMPPAQV